MNSKISPLTSVILMSSFQSNWSWTPIGVSNRGCGTGPPGGVPQAIWCLRMYSVNVGYFGTFDSPYLSTRYSWIAFLVTPGRPAFCAMTSRYSSKPLGFSDRPSETSDPLRQSLATVCRSIP